MDGELHPVDRVDYHAVFSDALTRLGKGVSVSEALEVCLKERHPLTYKDINAEAMLILSRLKQERNWGSVRALRELADHPELAETIRVQKKAGGSPADLERIHRPEVIADYPRIFALAQRKRQSGFSLNDSLEMAVRELYPQTFRKVMEAALLYIHLATQKRGIHELRALRELAEDPELLSELEDHFHKQGR